MTDGGRCMFLACMTVVLNCGVALGQDKDSANHMMAGCRAYVSTPGVVQNPQDAFDRGLCAGIVSGLVMAHPDVCPPAGSTRDQSIRIVVQYIDTRPARMHESFYGLAVE